MLNVEMQGRSADLAAAQRGSIQASLASEGLEDDLWLVPIEDRSSLGAKRRGLIEGFSLGQYLGLLDATARLQKDGKQQLPPEAASIFERLKTNAQFWMAQQELFAKERWRAHSLHQSRQTSRGRKPLRPKAMP